MKTTSHLILIILISASFFSCIRTEIDFSDQLPENKIVLNCFVEADSFITATVSKSCNLSQVYKNNQLRDAQIELYINGQLKEIMQPTPDTLAYPSHTSHTKAQTDDIVKLILKKNGYADIQSETVVPPKAVILSIDTFSFKDPVYNNKKAMRFFIKFKDVEARKKNYYRLGIEHEAYDQTRSVFYDYDSDPALREGFMDAIDEMLDNQTYNRHGTFDDTFFDGGEYTINVSADSYEIESGNIFQFRLVTLSESAYLYLKSLSYLQFKDEDIFYEPGRIFTNIQNGLGIMGASQIDTMSVVIRRTN